MAKKQSKGMHKMAGQKMPMKASEMAQMMADQKKKPKKRKR